MLGQAIQDAFKFEKATIQFKHLLGDIDLAKQRVAELREMGMSGAFGFDELKNASIALEQMTQGALTGTKYFTLIQDAAAATGKPVEQVAAAVGKFYNALRQGDDPARAVKQLRELGVVTGDAAEKLKQMSDDQEDAVKIFDKFTESMNRFAGANKEMADTAAGKLDYLQNKLKDCSRIAGEEFSNALAKSDVEVKKLGKDAETAATGVGKFWGTITKWSSQAAGKALGAILPQKIIDWYTTPTVEKEKPAENEEEKIRQGLASGAAAQKKQAEAAKEATKETNKLIAAIEKEVKAGEDGFKKQETAVKRLKDSIIQAKNAMNQAFSGSLTSTGAIGGYQSGGEAARATMALQVSKDQLDELKKQNDKLQQMNDNLRDLNEKLETARAEATFA